METNSVRTLYLVFLPLANLKPKYSYKLIMRLHRKGTRLADTEKDQIYGGLETSGHEKKEENLNNEVAYFISLCPQTFLDKPRRSLAYFSSTDALK